MPIPDLPDFTLTPFTEGNSTLIRPDNPAAAHFLEQWLRANPRMRRTEVGGMTAITRRMAKRLEDLAGNQGYVVRKIPRFRKTVGGGGGPALPNSAIDPLSSDPTRSGKLPRTPRNRR